MVSSFTTFLVLLLFGRSWSWMLLPTSMWRDHFPDDSEFKSVVDRRSLLASIVLVGAPLTGSAASKPPQQVTKEQTIQLIQDAIDTLQSVLDNWAKVVIDCTYADVPRELLSAQNKQELLKKASTNALFDKSVSVTSCKTTNRNVREYLGLTGKGPLVGIDKTVRYGMETVMEGDFVDEYVQSLEDLEKALARVASYSYSAGTVADLNAIQNFDESQQDKVLASDDNSNLKQTKQAVKEILTELERILSLLQK